MAWHHAPGTGVGHNVSGSFLLQQSPDYVMEGASARAEGETVGNTELSHKEAQNKRLYNPELEGEERKRIRIATLQNLSGCI